jgi:hypothetical protein
MSEPNSKRLWQMHDVSENNHDIPDNILNLLKKSPYVLIPTHGSYISTEPLLHFTVPENVCIFETMTIGDACRLSIVDDIDPILEDRNRFVNTLTASRNRDEGALKIIKNLTLYESGDIIYDRVLEGGLDELPIYYYPNGDILELSELTLQKDEASTQSLFIKELCEKYPELQKGVVILFASCATWGPGMSREKISEIMDHQYQQRLKFMSYTPVAPGGGVGGPSRILDMSANVQKNLPVNLNDYRVISSKVDKWLKRVMKADSVKLKRLKPGAAAAVPGFSGFSFGDAAAAAGGPGGAAIGFGVPDPGAGGAPSPDAGGTAAGVKRKRSNSQGGGGRRRKHSGRKSQKKRKQRSQAQRSQDKKTT